VPEPIGRDSGAEFTAGHAREWPGNVGEKTLYIGRGSRWENGYSDERFNGRLRDELPRAETFYTVKEAKVLIEA
jgi:hypothetical protein